MKRLLAILTVCCFLIVGLIGLSGATQPQINTLELTVDVQSPPAATSQTQTLIPVTKTLFVSDRCSRGFCGIAPDQAKPDQAKPDQAAADNERSRRHPAAKAVGCACKGVRAVVGHQRRVARRGR
jgi:hypothetical protein